MQALALLKQDIQQWNRWRASQNYAPCSLANADLSRGYFFEGDFRGVDLSGALLESACLIGANLQDVNLRGAILKQAYLDRANLNGADIRNADFTQANLTAVDLRNIQTEGTIFTDAKLTLVKVDEALREPQSPQQIAEKKPIVTRKKQKSAVLQVTKKKVNRKKASQQAVEHTQPPTSARPAVAVVSKKKAAIPTSQQSSQQLLSQLDLHSSTVENSYSPTSASDITEEQMLAAQLSAKQLLNRLSTPAPYSTASDNTTSHQNLLQERHNISTKKTLPQPFKGTVSESRLSILLSVLPNELLRASAVIAPAILLVILSVIFYNRANSQTAQQLAPALSIQSNMNSQPDMQPLEAASAESDDLGKTELSDPPFTLTRSLIEPSPVWAIATYSDGGRDVIASGNETGKITLRDAESSQVLQTFKAHPDTVRDIVIAPNRQQLVSSGSDGVKVWNLRTGELLYTLPSSAPVWSLAIAPDESRFISSDYDGTISVWQLETGDLLYNIDNRSTVWSVAIFPDGKSFAIGDSERLIRHLDLETGRLIQTFSGHQSDVRTLAISPDGSTLASGSWDKTVKLWSLQTGELKATLEGHRDRVVSVAISSDGSILASGSVDNTVKLWSLSAAEQISSLEKHTDWILSTAFLPKSNALVTGGKDSAANIWGQ